MFNRFAFRCYASSEGVLPLLSPPRSWRCTRSFRSSVTPPPRETADELRAVVKLRYLSLFCRFPPAIRERYVCSLLPRLPSGWFLFPHAANPNHLLGPSLPPPPPRHDLLWLVVHAWQLSRLPPRDHALLESLALVKKRLFFSQNCLLLVFVRPVPPLSPLVLRFLQVLPSTAVFFYRRPLVRRPKPPRPGR